MTHNSRIAGCLRDARALAASGDDAAALQRYMDLLQLHPDCVEALIELAVLAGSGGYRSAARMAFLRVLRLVPGHPLAHVGLGDLMTEQGDLDAAQRHYRAALSADPGFAPAHRGLAYCLRAMGDPAAQAHFQAGFAGHAVVQGRYRGRGTGIPLLLLVSASGGNIPIKQLIDDRVFAVTAIYTEFVDPATLLPPHALVVNAIGDADLCGAALAAAEQIVATDDTPIVNPPERVRSTGRYDIARRLAAVPGVVTPAMVRLRRSEAMDGDIRYPVLLRSLGYNTGQNFARAETLEELQAIQAALPGDELLMIEYLDASGPDGMTRKYRVMFIDGVAYPVHLAIGTHWKLHYFSSVMADHPAMREEERQFLSDMAGTLGPRAMAALAGINGMLGLDYAGVDFALAPDGSLLLFEANATMAIAPPDADPMWDYRRPAIAAVQNAVGEMLLRHAGSYAGPVLAPAADGRAAPLSFPR